MWEGGGGTPLPRENPADSYFDRRISTAPVHDGKSSLKGFSRKPDAEPLRRRFVFSYQAAAAILSGGGGTLRV